MYYCTCHSFYIIIYTTLFAAIDGPKISWERPKIELLIHFLNFHQNWDPSYIRRIIFPMMSTIFLREMATTTTTDSLLFGQFEFNSVKRVKTRYGYQIYVVKWKRAVGSIASKTLSSQSGTQEDVIDVDDNTVDLLDDCDSPEICEEDGCSFLLTDENMDLVGAAYPEEVRRFWHEQVFIFSNLTDDIRFIRTSFILRSK